MLYKRLAELYKESSSTTKRLEKIEILKKFLIQINENDKDVMYLLLGDIYPAFDERRIGISNQIAIKAISKATGTDSKEVIKQWKKIGDLGDVAEKLTKNKKQSTLQSYKLTVKKVVDNLRKLPELEGKGTISKKLGLITELLTSAEPLEALFLVRTLIGDLRIGIQESTVREAIAKTFFENEENSSMIIQKAIDKTNDLAAVFEIALKGNLIDLKKMKLKVGHPIKAMLAQKTETIESGFKALGVPCAVEYKYDGFRLVIHKSENEVTLYTRRLENVTKQFPEVKEYVLKYIKGKNFILDSEAVGFDKKNKEYKEFQKISQRIRRKYNIDKLSKELPVEINVFDILYYNGVSLLDEPFKKRSEIIRKILKPHPYKIIPSKQIITSNKETAEKFYKSALANNQEGIMLKSLDADYRPGRRVGHMLKLKPEEKDLDLVITGAEYGTGKRSGWMSSFILSCKKEDEFLEIGKVGTGIKEKTEEGVSFEELTKILKPLVIKEKDKNVEIKPQIVVSITFQEIQKSTNYNSGYALRFPKVIALRPDRDKNDIATLDEVKNAHRKKFVMY